MESKISTSFIPKKVLNTAPKRDKGSNIGIVFLITLIIFISVIALAVSAFLYQQFLVQDINRKKSSLERARAAFDPNLIQELSRLDDRIQASNSILDNHQIVSSLFDLLENITLKSISFDNFSYKTDEAGRVSIVMDGRASNFSSVALQSDVFSDSKFIEEPIFSNLNLDNKGNVIFNFAAFINPQLVLYKNFIQDTPVNTEEDNL
jgi:hypothetical protein